MRVLIIAARGQWDLEARNISTPTKQAQGYTHVVLRYYGSPEGEGLLDRPLEPHLWVYRQAYRELQEAGPDAWKLRSPEGPTECLAEWLIKHRRQFDPDRLVRIRVQELR